MGQATAHQERKLRNLEQRLLEMKRQIEQRQKAEAAGRPYGEAANIQLSKLGAI